MRKRLISQRALSTFFLIFPFTAIITATSITYGFSFLELAFSFNIGAKDEIVLSTMLLGYIISFLTSFSILQQKKSKLVIASMVLSSLGILSYGHEIVRLFTGYDFQIMINMAILLVILDWLTVKGANKLTHHSDKTHG